MTAHDRSPHPRHTTHPHPIPESQTAPADRSRLPAHSDHGANEGASPFSELMGEVMSSAERRAWVELVGHHAGQSNAADFGTFTDQHPALLDKKLLTHFYRSSTLASIAARNSWVEPDLAPFPWQRTDE